MTEIALALALGFGAGVLSGMFGVGGGILFVPTLTLVVGLGQLEAQATSLAAIIPVVALGAWRQSRHGLVRGRVALTVGLASAIGVTAGALLANELPEDGPAEALRGASGRHGGASRDFRVANRRRIVTISRRQGRRRAFGLATLWRMRLRLGTAVALCFVTVLVAGPAEAQQAGAKASSRALALRVVMPDGTEEIVGQASAPPGRLVRSEGLTYGETIVTTGSSWARARATASTQGAASASSTLRTVSLFDGEITVGAMSTRAIASASSKRATGSLSGSWLADVTILGTSVRATPNKRVQLADWGYVVLLEQAVVKDSKRIGRRTFVAALHVHLTADHGGLAAGTEIVVGYAEAAASAPRPPKVEDPKDGNGVPVAPPSGPSRDPKPGTDDTPPPVVQDPPENVKPQLTNNGYVFPVYGPAGFTNDFAAGRAHTGWHHGNDIFAPLGTPVLAVTDGTLFLVGWNTLGGNRLWLRDGQGNEFYYAHLTAYTPLAFDGSQVKAGDVIGFVGTTGDADGTPPHLHFEIHPAALLGLGYDGVVNPYPYLLAWRRVADASFDWSPKPGKVPQPGVVLLDADDISTASGLDPIALSGLMNLPEFFGESSAQVEPDVVGAPPGFGG